MKSAESGALSWRERFQGLSMAAVLTLLYAFSSAIILLTICTITYLGVARNLEMRDDAFIADELNVLLAMLEEPDGKLNLQEEINREQAERMHVTHYIRILDAQGRTLLENTQMDLILPSAVFPAATSSIPQLQHSIKFQASDGHVYDLRSIQTTVNGFDSDASMVQIAMDITSLETFLANFRVKLAVTLLLGVALSAVAGYITARRGLLPLSRITGVTQEMTASHLSERIHPGQWPRELASLARDFNGMLDRLKVSFDGLFHYTGNLAHELRTPINNLMMEADVALLRERTPQEYQKVIGSSMEEYERLSRLIDSLLFLARADSAAQRINLGTVDVGKELDRLSEFYSALATDVKVQVTCRGTATLSADPVLLRRAVSNLVSNSLKYTPPGGMIVMSALQLDDSSVEVAVSDTGCGIEPEYLPRIFDRFYRGDAADEMDVQGYGLGLSIVKAIMTMHGGSIEVQSRPAHGTTVTLLFPPAALRSLS